MQMKVLRIISTEKLLIKRKKTVARYKTNITDKESPHSAVISETIHTRCRPAAAENDKPLLSLLDGTMHTTDR